MLRAVLRSIFLLLILATLGLGGWWLFVTPPPGPPGAAPRPAAAERPLRPSAVARPSAGGAALHTPLGDAMFRWRCTEGLREAIGDRPDWPLRRLAAFCLCVADRLREEVLVAVVLCRVYSSSAVG